MGALYAAELCFASCVAKSEARPVRGAYPFTTEGKTLPGVAALLPADAEITFAKEEA